MPINADGVEVSPSHQIDGGTHFYAVFFTDVRIDANSLLGDLNNGCCMATAMRMYERVAIGSGTTGGISTARSDRLIRECRKRGIAADKGPKHGLDVRHGQITEPAVADAMGLPYTEPHDTLAQASQPLPRLCPKTTDLARRCS